MSLLEYIKAFFTPPLSPIEKLIQDMTIQNSEMRIWISLYEIEKTQWKEEG